MSGKISRRSCPACRLRADGGEGLGQKSGFDLWRCRDCQTLYTLTLPEFGHAEDYDHYYGEHNLTVPPFIHRRLDEIVAGFSIYQRQGRLLDIGFGAGSILQAAARAGWTVAGVEVSRPAVEHLKSQGYDVFCGDLAAANYPADYFDVVTASEVIEHVPEPAGLLEEIHRVLRPGGLLWATTPHSRGLSARALGLEWSVISPPEHLQLYSRNGIKTLLKNAGFRQSSVVTHGTNPLEIINRWRKNRAAAPSTTTTAAGDNGAHAAAPEAGFNRVATSCQLNEMLSSGGARRRIKDLANGALRITRLGDSLKIRAVK